MKSGKRIWKWFPVIVAAMVSWACAPTVPSQGGIHRDIDPSRSSRSWSGSATTTPSPARADMLQRRPTGSSRYSVTPSPHPTVNHSASGAMRYAPMVKPLAERHGIDYWLMLAIIQAESSGNPKARSNADCHGLVQLSIHTARDYSPDVSRADLYDPATNLRIGSQHMARLRANVHRAFPNADLEQRVVLLAAAWNAGWGRVSSDGGVPNIGETKRFASKVLFLYRQYRWNKAF